MEFHSTLQYRHPGGFVERDVTRSYTQQEVEDPEFVGLLRGVVKKRYDHCVLKEDLSRFWDTIAISPFSNQMVASDIKDPLYRFVHKILAETLIGRHKGDNKVNRQSVMFPAGWYYYVQ
ncbi:hypothetical protein Hanom_Chr14g01259081 [Helianthus anomalus]